MITTQNGHLWTVAIEARIPRGSGNEVLRYFEATVAIARILVPSV
jgi:hypothetical protein